MNRAPSAMELLRVSRGFRLLWGGTVVSFLGDWLTTVAVLTIVAELSGSSMWVSAVMVAKTLPIFLITPFAGPLADRIDRRTILIGTDLLRVVLVLAMLAAFWAESLSGVILFLLLRTFVGGCFIPARQASVPDLVQEGQISVAVAVMSGTWSVMLAFGAAIGGLITEAIGITGALTLDALTFLVSAIILWGLPPLPPGDSMGRDGSFRAGLRYLAPQRYLPALLLLKPSLSISGAMLLLLPIYAGGMFVGAKGPLYLGLLYGARGLGALIGSMGVRRLIGDATPTLQRAILVGFVVLSAMYLGLANAESYGVTAALIVFGMVGSGMVWTFAGTLALQATHREVRGRVFALDFGFTMAVNSLAFVVMGALLDAGVSPSTLCYGLALAALLPAAAWLAVLLVAPDVPTAPQQQQQPAK